MSSVWLGETNKNLLSFAKGFGTTDVHEGMLDIKGVKGPLCHQVWLWVEDRELNGLRWNKDTTLGKNLGFALRTILSNMKERFFQGEGLQFTNTNDVMETLKATFQERVASSL